MLVWILGIYPPSHKTSHCRRKKCIACSGVHQSVCHNPVSYFNFLPIRINTSIAADTRVLMEGARIIEGENSQVTKSFLCHCVPKIVLYQMRSEQWTFSFCSSHWKDQECETITISGHVEENARLSTRNISAIHFTCVFLATSKRQ